MANLTQNFNNFAKFYILVCAAVVIFLVLIWRTRMHNIAKFYVRVCRTRTREQRLIFSVFATIVTILGSNLANLNLKFTKMGPVL